MNSSTSLELFCTPIVLTANTDSFFLLLLDVQIIKVSTTAQEGTMISSLKGHHRHRPRPQSISPLYLPQAPQVHPLEEWTTPYRATTHPARCSASPTSCPTTQGTLLAQSPESQGHCTASHLRCSALVLPLPHCLWMAADITTTCPTRPRKWTRAPCGSFLRADFTGERFGNRRWWGFMVLGAGVENKDMDIDRVRAMPLNHYFWCFHIYLFIYFPIRLADLFCGNTVYGIKIMLKNIVFSIVFGCFSCFFCILHSTPTLHPKLDLQKKKRKEKKWKKKNWARLLTCLSFSPISLGTWGTLSPLLTPVMAQHNNQTPYTHQGGRKQPFRNLL